MRRPWIPWLVTLAVVGAACSGDAGGDASSSTTTSVPSIPSTTPTSTTLATPTLVEAEEGCPTAYGSVATIEIVETASSACVRAGFHQELRLVNLLPEPFELTWGDEVVSIPSQDTFQPWGTMWNNFTVGAWRLPAPQLPITIEVVDPETSEFTTEAMFLRRWGSLRPGESLTEAEAGGVSVFFPPDPAVIGEESEFCRYGFVENDPYSPWIMILDGETIARIEAFAPEHETASGIGPGSTTEDVLEAYPDQIDRSPHEYVENGEYLTFVPVDDFDSSFALVFETSEDGIVTSFRTGLAGPVRWVEGCL